MTTAGEGTDAATEVAIRRMTTEDVPAVEALVAEGRAAAAWAGSADPTGSALAFLGRIAPQTQAVAAEGERLVGVLGTDVKTVYVTPDARRRGIGRSLVEEGLRIERERMRPELLLGTLPGDAAAEAFLRATGFAVHSTVWTMSLAPDVVVPEPAWPAWVTTRPFAVPADVPAFVDAFNEAFSDHPTPMQVDPAVFESDETQWWVPEDAILLEDRAAPGRIVGFVSVEIGRRPGDEPMAEVQNVGVRPSHQGRGLGRELLRWAVHRLRELRDQPVTLSVNGRNDGALGLYEREGFVRSSTRDRWARPTA